MITTAQKAEAEAVVGGHGIDTSPLIPLPRRDKESECAGTSTGLRPPSPQRGEGPGGEGDARERRQRAAVDAYNATFARHDLDLIWPVELVCVSDLIDLCHSFGRPDIAKLFKEAWGL